MLVWGKMLSCSLFMKFCTKVGPLCRKVSPPSNISPIPGFGALINIQFDTFSVDTFANEKFDRPMEVSLLE